MPDCEWDSDIHAAEDLYSKAAYRWGGDAQMAKAAEEFSELAAVCARDLNGQADSENLLEELADARIMLEQLVWHLADGPVEAEVKAKLEALEDRLNGGQVDA